MPLVGLFLVGTRLTIGHAPHIRYVVGRHKSVQSGVKVLSSKFVGHRTSDAMIIRTTIHGF